MKKLFTFLAVVMMAAAVWAQSPQMFSYQAVVRDAQGQLVQNQTVGIQISILRGNTEGTAVYAEYQQPTTDAHGIFNIQIGAGTAIVGSMAAIEWGNGSYFLKSEIDPAGGTYYTMSAVQQLLSVPYALYAERSGNGGFEGEETDPVFTAWGKDYDDLTNKPTIPTAVSQLTNDAGYITLSDVPVGFSGNYDDLTNKPGIGAVAGVSNSVNTQLKNVSNPTDAQDAVTKAYLDAVIAEMRASLLDSIAAHAGSGSGGGTTGGTTGGASEGCLTGVFSVSASSTVKFSQGNLQYQASTNTWRFAANQYDIIGSSNSSVSSSYSGYIDLFGWGTSGWNSGANAYYPYSTSTSYSDYYPGGSYSNSLTGSYANADWGVYNAISNGGNQAGMWRTLTKDEWDYLFNSRPNASSKQGLATVNGVAGMVLLPDNWTLPSGCTFTAGRANGFTTNTYTTAQWTSMQSNGAVFLPAAGYRYGAEVSGVGTYGLYWSSTYNFSDDAYYMCFSSDYVSPAYSGDRNYGQSVRLVQDN